MKQIYTNENQDNNNDTYIGHLKIVPMYYQVC